jgi:DNA-3-methyladenine glycosylase
VQRRLTKAFYERDAVTVARDLIGCVFVHRLGSDTLAVRLVETEAYRGVIDPGSHGYRGITPRTEVMYGPPARLYVYFTYGMHWCVNIVSGREGECEAVLLRAGEPLKGVPRMRRMRGPAISDHLIAAGPARLAQALGIDKRHNGVTLLRGGEFWCYEDLHTAGMRTGEVSQTPRVGLGAGRGDDIPWRFVVPNNRYASRRR